MPTILLLKCGSASAAVRLAHGDYDRWFMRAILRGATRSAAPSARGARAPPSPPLATAEPHPAPPALATRLRLRVVDAYAGAPLPAGAGGADAIVATGSPRSVAERAPWMARAGAWLREEAERGLPVLGVCFGHQLLAEAFGGAVGRSPSGREIGTVRCELTAAGREDPLFDGVPGSFEAQATHEDEVRMLPAGAELLATNSWSRVQAFRIGPNVRAVQFHPEMDGASMAAVAAARADGIAAEARARGDDPEGRVRAVLAVIREAPWGERILANFVERFAGGRAARWLPPMESVRRSR